MITEVKNSEEFDLREVQLKASEIGLAGLHVVVRRVERLPRTTTESDYCDQSVLSLHVHVHEIIGQAELLYAEFQRRVTAGYVYFHGSLSARALPFMQASQSTAVRARAALGVSRRNICKR